MAFDWSKEYDTLDEIPEGARDAFEEKDGKYVLVKALSKSALQTTLDRQKDEIKTLKGFKKKFEGLDLDDDQLESLADDLEELQTLRDLKETGQLSGDDLDKKAEDLAEKKLEAAQRKHEREIGKVQKQLDEANEALGNTSGKLKTLSIEREARDLAAKHKISSTAIKDVLLHVKNDFDLDDEGSPTHKSGNGQSLSDWFEESVPENPHWQFDPKNAGSGAHGGNGKSGGGKTYKRAEFDQLAKENPPKAREVMASVRKGEAQFVD